MDLGNPKNTIEVIQKYNFAFQKKFGQNFLIDTHVLDKIISAAGMTKEDTVLEVGPGIGTMTQRLSQAAGQVIAVEIDTNLIPILKDTLQDCENVTVINEDILKIDIKKMAEEKGLDLVEISPNAQPPVCRIIDYSKFLYQLKKRQKEQKAKQVKVNVKEIRFGPQTDEHDYDFKKKHAIRFLQEGSKIKAYVFFKGRSIIYKDQGEILLLRLATDLEEYGKVDQLPKQEGKQMIMYLSPKKKK